MLKLFCVSKQRLDGRETYDYRKLRISFGVDRGHCEVQLGRTRYGKAFHYMLLRYLCSNDTQLWSAAVIFCSFVCVCSIFTPAGGQEL